MRAYSEATLEQLAASAPHELLRLIASATLDPADLTFAAEAAGRIGAGDAEAVRAALLPLLGHASSVVREGAIYGLVLHMDPTVRLRLVEVAARDASPAVRSVAAETLESE